jgi:antitoxin ParD1/3/4
MATMNISLPDSMKAFVDAEVAERGYSTSSEYVRDLIRREADLKRLRDMIQEGLDSPLEGPMDAAYFDDLRRRIRERSAA